MMKEKKAVKKKTTNKESMIEVFNLEGKEKKEIGFIRDILVEHPNKNLLAQYIHIYLTNQRQGTASTKTRGEVAGSTRKIYRQKGTGRARHGSVKAPIFVGGGVVGGPIPKKYQLKINSKQRKIALYNALTLSYKLGNIFAIFDSSLETKPKTKIITNFLKIMKIVDKKVLIIFPKLIKNNLLLAVRNISNINIVDVKSLNAYTILNNEKIIFIEGSLKVFKEHFCKKNEN